MAKYLRSTLLLMTIGGTFRIKTRSPIRKLLFDLWRITMNFVLLCFMVSCFIDLRNKGFARLELVSKHYVYFGACIYISFRLNYFYKNDQFSSDLVEEIRNVFKDKTEIGFEDRNMKNYVKFTNMLTYIWIFYGTLLGQSDILLCSIFRKNRELALPMWFPFDWRISPYFELVVLVQMFVLQALVVMSLGMDTFFVNTIVLTSGQFKLLGWELKHVLHKQLLKSGIELDQILVFMRSCHERETTRVDEALLSVLNSESVRTNLLKNLRELADFHQFLLTLSTRLDEFFSSANLLCFCTLLAVGVVLMYSLIMTENMMFRILNAMYALACLIMLFLPCFFGNLLTSHAEEVLSCLYDLPWYMCDEKFRTNFRMLQQRAGKQVFLKVGKFANLSLETYLWILRAIYSYLTMLRQVTENS